MTRGYLLGSIGFSLVLLAACGASDSDVGDPPDTTTRGGSAGKSGASGKSGAAGGTTKGGAAGSAGKSGAGGASAGAGGAKGGSAGSAGAAGKSGGAGTATGGAAGQGGGGSVCSAGRGDCNESATDGCETDLTSTVAHCGACDKACPAAGPSANVSCQAGECKTTCFLGTGDCDGDAKNGCETNTNEDITHCGSCGAPACPDGANGKAACDGGSCAFACDTGFGDCTNAPGCETTLTTDVNHCGACGNACGPSATCKNGACECAATTSVAELIPVDLHLLLDKSGSMSESVKCTLLFFCSSKTKWSETTKAIKEFLGGVTAADRIGMGLTLFPQGNATQACPVSLYEKPAVESADLPGVAGALTGGINGAQPDGENTPTRAALEGAVNHAVAFQAAHPDRKSVVLLATDGEPTGCEPNGIDDVGNVAAAGNAKGVPTYVIGVFSTDTVFGGGGDAKDALNGWAQKGGTNKAFFPAVGDSLATEFKATLDQIRKTAIGCEYVVPKPTGGQAFDPNKVNVLYTPGGGGADQTLLNVPDAASCKAGAWYYDNPTTPTKILLCPELCPTVKNDAAGKVQVSVGCGTRKD